jgi:hypothetical protein
MRRALTSTLVVLAVAVPGCGGGGDEPTIPRDEANRLVELLQQAQIAGGDQDRCDTLLSLVPRIESEVANLPSSVDDDTRQTLEDGVDNLGENARSECAGVDETETTETETTPTETTEPEPTTTETVPPPTTTEEEPPPPTTTEEEPPPPTEPPEEPTVPPSGGTPPGNGNGPEAAPGQQQRKKHHKKPKPDKGSKPGKGPKH